MLYVVNKSTLVSDADVRDMTRACNHQVRFHACPFYWLEPVPVQFAASEKDAPEGSYVIAVLDDPDQQGALGWHTEDAGDLIFGEVFVRPVLDNGGTAMTGPLTVSSVLSHEVLETVVDPHANNWADNGDNTFYAYECADAVESDSYPVMVDGFPVMVSDFVTPAWFDHDAADGSRFDYMGLLSGPFEVRPNGYVIVSQGGQVNQLFGESLPEWRKTVKARPLGGRRTEGTSVS